MKIRKGFVTNSSSTSYICEISGEKSDIVWDTEDMRDVGFVRCSNEHIFLEDFILDVSEEKILEYIRSYANDIYKWVEKHEDYEMLSLAEEFAKTGTVNEKEQEEFFDYCRKYYFEDFHGVLPIECPICQMQEFSMYDLIDYLSKKTNITDKEVLEYVKSKNKRRKRTYAIDHVNYALMKLDMTIEELKDEIRNNFKSYDEFENHIRGV